jgi:hypothetical protein
MINEFEIISPLLKERIELHHKLYPVIPVKAEYWESMLVTVFKEKIPNSNPVWDCGSQQIGKDITLYGNMDISCKAGQIQNDGRIKISSSRLSRFADDTDAMKTYLTERKTDDYILCLSTYKYDRKKNNFNGKYVSSLFKSDFINYSTMKWETFGKDNNVCATNDQNISLTMTKAMGWQVWYYIPATLALASHDLSVKLD